MRALVVGGHGRLGPPLREALEKRGHEVHWTSRRRTDDKLPNWCHRHYLDLLEPELPDVSWATYPENCPVVYLMAAVTGVVPAERHHDAWRVNAEGPLMLALQAARRCWHIVSMSSGTVELAPHSASAMQKAYLDAQVLALGGTVVRPMPFVQPEWYDELANLLVDVGEQRRWGIVRWRG